VTHLPRASCLCWVCSGQGRMQAEMRWGRKSWRGGGRVRRTARCARPHHGEATAGRQCCGGGRACAALPWVPGRRELSSWLWQRQRVRTPHPRKGAGSPGRWARPQATQHMAMAAGRPTQLQGVRVASPSSLHLPSRSSSGNPLGCWLPFPLAIAIHLLPAPTTGLRQRQRGARAQVDLFASVPSRRPSLDIINHR